MSGTTVGKSFYLFQLVVVFFDDVLIYSKSKRENMKHLRAVFKVLKKNKLFGKESNSNSLLWRSIIWVISYPQMVRGGILIR